MLKTNRPLALTLLREASIYVNLTNRPRISHEFSDSSPDAKPPGILGYRHEAHGIMVIEPPKFVWVARVGSAASH
jgi:hypothetical protein